MGWYILWIVRGGTVEKQLGVLLEGGGRLLQESDVGVVN